MCINTESSPEARRILGSDDVSCSFKRAPGADNLLESYQSVMLYFFCRCMQQRDKGRAGATLGGKTDDDRRGGSVLLGAHAGAVKKVKPETML